MDNQSIKDKFEKLLRDKLSLIFILVLIFSIAIRLYYFFQTNSQPLWWDEADYVSMSKSIIGTIDYPFTIQRPPLFPILGAAFFFISGSEAFVRFFIVLLPSIGVVIMTYLFGKILYNKRVGIIASLIMGVFWVLLFNTFRIHTDALALLFIMLSMYSFWKYNIKSKQPNKLWLVGMFLGLAVLTRIVYVLFVPLLGLFLLFVEGFAVLRKKWIYYTAGAGFLVLLPYIIWSQAHFGKLLAFTQGYTSYEKKAESLPFAWNVFGYFKLYTGDVLYILFLLGALLVVFDLVIGFDRIRKRKKLISHLFLSLTIILPVIYFAFIERSAGEPRWLIMIAPAMFYFIALFLVKLYYILAKYHKYAALLVVLVLLGLGVYHELSFSDDIITQRKESFSPVKLSALWIKENSEPGDYIITKSVPQVAYYSERPTTGMAGSVEDLREAVKEFNPRFLILSIYEVHTPESLNFPESLGESLNPVHGYFADEARTQPVLVVYEFINYDF
jgi:4-amino-4-deoxy-L-arabinose transferase-like glycosyltransferase